MKDFFKQNKSKIAIVFFLVFLAAGIFLRTYNFHDWLRFNTDQARDAVVVSDFLEGKTALPLLGPKAGGTDFKLGPIFYYFQIISAKIFGVSPDKIAYPDLLFSMLSIPLLFFLFRMYFNVYISAACTSLLSVSMFSMQYSRFAWNPNSIPFFVFLFLYALLAMEKSKTKKKFFWAALAGVALGVGVQLHTTLLISMPIVLLIFLEYIYKTTGKTMTKEFIAIFLFALVLNVPQIFGEFKNDGQNMLAFFKGALVKSETKMNAGEKIVENFLCQIQSNNYIISAIGPSGDCGKTVISSELKRHKHFDKKLPIILETLLGILFTIGGIALWARCIKREKEKEKKDFLVLLGIYFSVMFLLLIPLAREISTRFYLTLEFIPFLLFGFWANTVLGWAKEKRRKFAIAALGLCFVLLVVSNAYKTSKMFGAFFSPENIGNDGVDNDSESFITLGEAQFIADYITSHVGQSKTVYLDGKQTYLFKYVRPLRYFTKMKDIDLKAYSKKELPPEDALIMTIGNLESEGELSKSMREKYSIEDSASYGRFSIAALERKR